MASNLSLTTDNKMMQPPCNSIGNVLLVIEAVIKLSRQGSVAFFYKGVNLRIAVIEDNLMLSDGIARAFKREGHGVDQIHDGQDALEFLRQEPIDLAILDINLPGLSGLEILNQLRNEGFNKPILLLTARSTLDDKIAGLDCGADDYLTKPFDLEELQARARALLRRGEKRLDDQIQCGDIIYNMPKRQLTLNGEVLDLPRRELALAELLIRRVGHVYSKQQILDHLYGSGTDVEDGAAELYVSRLRKKLSGGGIEIKTLRGLGYCMRESEL